MSAPTPQQIRGAVILLFVAIAYVAWRLFHLR
jgi:hypothetical protein